MSNGGNGDLKYKNDTVHIRYIVYVYLHSLILVLKYYFAVKHKKATDITSSVQKFMDPSLIFLIIMTTSASYEDDVSSLQQLLHAAVGHQVLSSNFQIYFFIPAK